MKFDTCDNFTKNNSEYTVYYSGETEEQKNSICEFCKIFTTLWNDYQIENDDKTKNVFFESFFLKQPIEKYTFDKNKDDVVITSNNDQYFAKGDNVIHIFFDYKEQKNPIIENIFDVMEVTVCTQNNESGHIECIDFVSRLNNNIRFCFNSIGITLINNMDKPLNIIVNIIPLLEELEFCIPAHTKQFGTMYDNYCVISQIKI